MCDGHQDCTNGLDEYCGQPKVELVGMGVRGAGRGTNTAGYLDLGKF